MKQTVVITGSNRGIGLELCRQYHQRGDHVIALCRHSSPDLEHLGVQIITGLDVSDPNALVSLGKKLREVRIHLLINNAGTLNQDQLGQLDFNRLEQTLLINSLGPLRVTQTLLGNLQQGSKIAMITSRMGSMTDNQSGSYYGYRMSKAALNAASVSLAHDLKPKGIAVAILHPGFVQTDMTAHQGHILPNESARQLIERIDELDLEHSGSFLHANGENLPW